MNNQNKKILYIEDNPTNLRLVQRIIERMGNLTFLSAHDPKLGIELAKGHHPDLILMDINLPGIDGYQALKILQDCPETKDTPVIAISANAMKHDLEKGKEAGFIDYLTKPINLERLNKVITQAIED